MTLARESSVCQGHRYTLELNPFVVGNTASIILHCSLCVDFSRLATIITYVDVGGDQNPLSVLLLVFIT